MTDKLTDEKLAEWEALAVAASPGPWHAGHLCRDDHPCDCPYVLDEGHAGGICDVKVDNGLPVGEGGNDGPSREEAKANQRHIAFNNPDFALSAIAELHRLRGERDEAVGLVRDLVDGCEGPLVGAGDGNTRVVSAPPPDVRQSARAFLAKLEERG